MKVEVIVSRMNYSSRNTFYGHTRKKDLPLPILARYGRVFKYDFSDDIEEMNEIKVHEEEHVYLKAPIDLEDATSQRDFYHKLYMDLLEKVRALEKENAVLRSDKGFGKK